MSHYTKLEFLAFNGDGLTEWLHKVKQLFKIDNTIDAIKVKLASIHFEGQTLHQYTACLSTREKEKVFLWDEFVDALVDKFEEDVIWVPIVELKKLR